MKRIFLTLCIMLLIFMSGCSIKNNEVDYKEKLNNVLNNKETFIKENGKKVLLKDYIIAEDIAVDAIFAEPYEYAFVDFDQDEQEELVINISENYGYYVILHFNNENIYGYEFGVRALSSLKADGSFIGSDGADINYYCRLSFEDNKKNIKYEAIKDSTLGVFKLNGKNVSLEELNEFINDWKEKKKVKWIKIESDENAKDEKAYKLKEVTGL